MQVPDEADWQVTDAFHSYVPLPVPAALLRESCTSTSACRSTTSPCSSNLGDFATRNRLIQAGVTFRPAQQRCPWNRRRYTD